MCECECGPDDDDEAPGPYPVPPEGTTARALYDMLRAVYADRVDLAAHPHPLSQIKRAHGVRRWVVPVVLP